MERKHQVASAVRRALIMGALTAAGAAPALAGGGKGSTCRAALPQAGDFYGGDALARNEVDAKIPAVPLFVKNLDSGGDAA